MQGRGDQHGIAAAGRQVPQITDTADAATGQKFKRRVGISQFAAQPRTGRPSIDADRSKVKDQQAAESGCDGPVRNLARRCRPPGG